METFNNPIEDVFSWISIFIRVLVDLFAGVKGCNLGPNEVCTPIVSIVGIALILLFCAGLCFYGYRLAVQLGPFANAVLAVLFIQFLFRQQSDLVIFISSLSLVILIVLFAILIDKYRGVFYIAVIGSIVGGLAGGILQLPAGIGQMIGLLFAFILGCIPSVRENIARPFDWLTTLASGVIGGGGLVLLGSIVSVGLFEHTIFMTWYTNAYTSFMGGVLATIFAFIVGLAALIAFFAVPILGIRHQFKARKEEREKQQANPAAPTLFSPAIFSILVCAVIVVYVYFNLNSINSSTITQLPLPAQGQSFLVDKWVSFQEFSHRAIRPWYRYAGEPAQTEFTAYFVPNSNTTGMDGYACPQTTCTVFGHFYKGEISRDEDVGFLGINAQGNYLDQVEGEPVGSSNLWYVFLNENLQAIYIPAQAIEKRTVPPIATPW